MKVLFFVFVVASSGALDNIEMRLYKKYITINHLKYNDNADLLVQVQGERSAGIRILNTNTAQSKQKLLTDFGATGKVVRWE